MSHDALNTQQSHAHHSNPRHGRLTALQIINRVAASLLGGYAFTWGFSTLGIAAMVGFGMSFHDAEHSAQLLAFLVFLTVFLWAIAAANLARVWIILAGGGTAMTTAAWALQQTILS